MQQLLGKRRLAEEPVAGVPDERSVDGYPALLHGHHIRQCSNESLSAVDVTLRVVCDYPKDDTIATHLQSNRRGDSRKELVAIGKPLLRWPIMVGSLFAH